MAESISGTDLTCQQIIDFLRAYLDGELPPREREIFDLHLAICPDCVNYLQSYRTTLVLQRAALGETRATAPISGDLLQAILAARRQ